MSAELRVREYAACVTAEESTPWGLRVTWTITRSGVEVGRMYDGAAGYGERAICSMRMLVWSGDLPPDCTSPKSPHYGIHFDTGPCDTREEALAEFAKRADRLLAWRAAQS